MGRKHVRLISVSYIPISSAAPSFEPYIVFQYDDKQILVF